MAITGPHLNLTPYIENEITDGEHSPTPSTNHIWKENSTHKGLMNFISFAIVPFLFYWCIICMQKNDFLINFITSVDVSKAEKINLEQNLG